MKKINNIFKILAAAALALTVILPLSAQDEVEISTLFSNKDGHVDHGGWGGLTFGYTQIKDKETYLMGARGGWLIDHHFTIGLAGCGFISDRDYLDPKINGGDPFKLAGGYGGLYLEANIAPFYPVHFAIPVTIGAGGVSFSDQRWWDDNQWDHPNSLASDAFFVIEPGLEIEVNVIKFMRFSVGGSYRYTSMVSMGESYGDMLRGFNGHFTLKFGRF